MLILPFTHNKVTHNNFEVNIFKFLTIGGYKIWEENGKLNLDHDILNPSDIYRKSQPVTYDKKLQLCEVDTEKTNLNDFFKWEEIDLNETDTFCWRTYIYLTGTNGQSWLDIPDTEKLNTYLVRDIIKKLFKKVI